MSERLRIAQVAPIAVPVTPVSEGSIEQLVSLLTEELVRRGHEVTLFATGQSQTSAMLHATYPVGYEDDDDLGDWRFHETMHMASVFERAREFDVIHSHVYHFALPFTRLVATPVAHTYHVIPNKDVVRVYARYPDAHFVAISEYQRRVTRLSAVAVIHHGIDTAAFPFNPKKGRYLLFLGRIMARKGTVEAIHLAKQMDMPLVIAGPPEDDYFEAEVAPLVDGRLVQYVGPVDHSERNKLLSGAATLLYPIMASEPFGLVMIEAMACGTPVAAIRRGSVSEIVENGLSGYSAPDLDSVRACLPSTLALDRTRVRQRAIERFDYRRMTDDYEELYQRLVVHRRSKAV